MIENISVITVFLTFTLSLTLFVLVFFMALEVSKDLNLFEMPAAVIIAACAAFFFIFGMPLLGLIAQLLEKPDCNLLVEIAKNFESWYPAQIALITIATLMWVIIKGSLPPEENHSNHEIN